MTSKMILSPCGKLLMFIFMQKIIFIPPIFFEILKRYCELVIFGTLDMPGHAHHQRQYHLAGNSNIYPQTKNQLHPSYPNLGKDEFSTKIEIRHF